ncbi:hypothetical protein TNCV_751091 [Trichonephila clavipes]|nr:hypothetical protein TNCV_751091 [Trichonephila clavipes]
MWQRGLIGSTANARVPSQKQSAFTSRREQWESVSSTRERSVDICSRLLPLDERLYLAPSASRLKCAGYLAKVKEDRCCKKIFLAKPMGNRDGLPVEMDWLCRKNINILKVKTRKQLPEAEMPGEGQSLSRAVEPLKKKIIKLIYLKRLKVICEMQFKILSTL